MLETLRALDTPILDRRACERLFGVGRRRAIDLMQRFGGYQAGNAVLLDRADLIRRLEEIGSSPEVERERTRKRKVSEALTALRSSSRAVRVRIPVSPGVDAQGVDGLPGAVRLENGRLSIEFDGAMELLTRLYELSQAAATDYDRFCAAAEGRPV